MVSSKAGYTMWPGPYGDWGSKSTGRQPRSEPEAHGAGVCGYLYHHRPDPETPLEETMAALDLLVQGKALYVGLSNYPAERARQAFDILQRLGTPCVIHQPKYSMLERGPETALLDTLAEHGVGSIASRRWRAAC
ncbi:aldo/keto reductase [Serratia ureilytica]